MLPGKNLPWIHGALKMIFINCFFSHQTASESIKTHRVTQREVPTNALHAVHQHHGKDGAIPASVFAPRKADRRIFFCFCFMFKLVLWQKIWLNIWQSFESHNLIPVNFIRSLRNEPWIWHDFGHVAFRGIHLQATYINQLGSLRGSTERPSSFWYSKTWSSSVHWD